MSPTIVLDGGEVRYVVGSPGGSTIITTVLQMLLNRIDLGMTLPEAVAAPRASQRNTANNAPTPAEAEFIAAYADDLAPFAQFLTRSAQPEPWPARSALRRRSRSIADGLMTAAAEPVRRGGGTGLVVEPAD